jgi:hypothetical protein
MRVPKRNGTVSAAHPLLPVSSLRTRGGDPLAVTAHAAVESRAGCGRGAVEEHGCAYDQADDVPDDWLPEPGLENRGVVDGSHRDRSERADEQDVGGGVDVGYERSEEKECGGVPLEPGEPPPVLLRMKGLPDLRV